jgi:hypothetical protein
MTPEKEILNVCMTITHYDIDVYHSAFTAFNGVLRTLDISVKSNIKVVEFYSIYVERCKKVLCIVCLKEHVTSDMSFIAYGKRVLSFCGETHKLLLLSI